MSRGITLAERLPPEVVSMYGRLRLNGMGRTRAIKTVEEAFPDVKEKTSSWANFERSKRGLEMLKAMEEGAGTDDLERYGLLARKATRVATLADTTTRLIDRFDKELDAAKPNIRNATSLNREIRTNLGAIRDEVQGLGLESEPVLSHLERVTKALESLSRKRQRELLGDLQAGPWKQPQKASSQA